MSKNIKCKAKRGALKQGNILSFVKPQTTSQLLKSKDGLKQGRIEPFLSSRKSLQCQKLTPQKKKRLLSGDTTTPVKAQTEVNKKARMSPSFSKASSVETIDLTDDCIVRKLSHPGDDNIAVVNCEQDIKEDISHHEKPIDDGSSSKSTLLKIATVSPTHNQTFLQTSSSSSINISATPSQNHKGKHLDTKQPQPSHILTDEKHTDDVTKTELELEKDDCRACEKGEHREDDCDIGKIDVSDLPESDVVNNQSLNMSDLSLNDSFITAALDDSSRNGNDNLKKPKQILLSCAISSTSKSHSLRKYRHAVLEVSESTGINGYPIKVLELENVATKDRLTCTLCDGWYDTKVRVHDIVNLILDDDNTSSGQVKVDAKHNLLILHPDILLSGTTVSNAIGCQRRAVLSERFKNTESRDGGTPVMLIGTLAHTIFQNAVKSRKKFTQELLFNMAESEVSKPKFLKDLFSQGSTRKEVLDAVRPFLPQIISWVGEYVRDHPTTDVGKLDLKLPPGYAVRELDIDPLCSREKRKNNFEVEAAITQVEDIEENVWSPLYGLKGKIDVTGEFTVRRRSHHGRSSYAKMVLPLELKTGKESHSIEHHAQVAIYSMFCQRRRKIGKELGTLPAGLLLYMKTKSLSCIPFKSEDRRELTMLRNSVAGYLTRSIIETEISIPDTEKSRVLFKTSSFPATIDNERFCKNCSQLRNCSLVHCSIDRNAPGCYPSPEMLALMKDMNSHLTNADLDYFEHWTTCTLLEARKSIRNDTNQYIWLRSPKERNAANLCVTNLVLAGPAKQLEDEDTLLQTFKVAGNSEQNCNDDASNQASLDIFTPGDLVVVSGTEPDFVGMDLSTVKSVQKNFITLYTERNFSGYPINMRYSIDRHEWSSLSSFNPLFRNLSVVMDASQPSARLRDLIISHREPQFKTSLNEVIPRSSKEDVAKMLRGLNRTQRQAIKRVLLSRDYTLVVGMPGSGKTTTIVAMVRILLLCGCRILLTSYTHSAIDNLLIKLIKYKVKFLRLGRASQIHSSVQPYCDEELTKHFKTVEELNKLYCQANVVGCTCLAVTTHALFTSASASKFDVCLVDEASQIAQPACLAPLLHAIRFVLVGDHRQLPPLVRSRKARLMGADESLFWRLSHHKEALCELTLQYRMNSTIMNISNHVTYEGRLECAADFVADASLKLSMWEDISKRVDALAEEVKSWLMPSLDPSHPVVFLDTTPMEAYEEEIENGICNSTEAEILKTVVEYLMQAGCLPENIGIISPFRRQLKTIEEKLDLISGCTDKVEINTVDKYQGRDKSVILMSFVRSRKEEDLGDKKGEILSDWRRLNVALTRAKHKMVLVGSRKALKQYESCAKLLTYLHSKDMIVTYSA